MMFVHENDWSYSGRREIVHNVPSSWNGFRRGLRPCEATIATFLGIRVNKKNIFHDRWKFIKSWEELIVIATKVSSVYISSSNSSQKMMQNGIKGR